MLQGIFEVFEEDGPFSSANKECRYGIREVYSETDRSCVVYEADFDNKGAEIACEILNDGGPVEWEELSTEMKRRGWIDPLATA